MEEQQCIKCGGSGHQSYACTFGKRHNRIFTYPDNQ